MIINAGPFCRKGFSYCRKANLCDVDTSGRLIFKDHMHSSRGEPRSPARQAGPTKDRCPAGRTYKRPLPGRQDLQKTAAREAGPTKDRCPGGRTYKRPLPGRLDLQKTAAREAGPTQNKFPRRADALPLAEFNAAILPPVLSQVPLSVSVADRKSPKLPRRSPLLDISDVLC
jgi:hypothetical protein